MWNSAFSMTKKTDTKIDPEMQTSDVPQDSAAISDDDLQDVINNAASSDAGDANAAASETSNAETSAQSDQTAGPAVAQPVAQRAASYGDGNSVLLSQA